MKKQRTLIVGMVLGSSLTVGVLALVNVPWHQLAVANTATAEAGSAVASSNAMFKQAQQTGDRGAPASKTDAWYPRTERVADDEMFVVALGTGMPTPITRAQKSSATTDPPLISVVHSSIR